MGRTKAKKHVEEYESWYKTRCPYCNSVNYHSNGDERDLSAMDVDSIKCCQCFRVYGFGPDSKCEFPTDGIPRL